MNSEELSKVVIRHTAGASFSPKNGEVNLSGNKQRGHTLHAVCNGSRVPELFETIAMKTIAMIGGVSAAYASAKHGLVLTPFERNLVFANGRQLSASSAEAWTH